MFPKKPYLFFRPSLLVLTSTMLTVPLFAEKKAEKKEDVKPSGELIGTEWAGDTLLGSPVAISMDNHGRAYVAQTRRRKESEQDIRSHGAWVVPTLSFESVEDRRKFYEKELSSDRSASNKWLKDRNGDGISDLKDLGVLSELVLRVEDKSGRGTADTRTVFVDGLNDVMTGVAAGVLWFDGNVYLTAIPSVWKFSDQRTPGAADVKKEEMLTGFGVHVAYSGHDMHGLTVGPDGRIYWTIGDKGMNVTLPDGKHVKNAHSGAVLRCEPDGSGLELYATGLRNPQELAFDDAGNLFSVDNDGDFKGERERFVYIAEHSDSGWRCNWQYRKGDYNPWTDEKLFQPAWKGQAAYITPPISNYSDGPCGFTFNPGTALGEKYRNTFFLTQFPGRKLNAFKTEAVGAGFKMVEERLVFSGPMMTGLSWGPDGALYVADWNSAAWEPHEKGKIWKLDVPAADANPQRAATQKLLADGFGNHTADGLGKFLGHADRRIRQSAQFELVRRKDSKTLLAMAQTSPNPNARVHAVWGLGQLGRKQPDVLQPLVSLLASAAPELRIQVLKVMADANFKPAAEVAVKLLADGNDRLRYQAAIALAKIGNPSMVPAVVSLLETANGKDVFLRHAGIAALAGMCAKDSAALQSLSTSTSEEVRLCAVVAIRRLAHPSVASFLKDAAPLVIAEAARAIHDDYSIPDALPALAAALGTISESNPVITRRAISANLRMGGAEAATRLVAFAAAKSATSEMRVEALKTLATWTKPEPLDRVEGCYRPLEPRDAALVHAALANDADTILADAAPEVRAAACELMGRIGYTKAGPALFATVTDEKLPAKVHQAALAALAVLKDPKLEEATKLALDSKDAALRADAMKLFATSGKAGDSAIPLLVKVLQKGKTDEQQSAFATLGGTKSPAAAKPLAEWLDKLIAGKVSPALQLDVLEAARAHGDAGLLEKVAAYEKSKPADDPTAPFRETLQGGNAARGKTLALEHLAAQCTRCHKLGGAGAEVGPDLSKVASRLPREQLLESLVAPNNKISEGFGIIILTLTDGSTASGSVTKETESELTLKAPDGAITKLEKSKIKDRTQPMSMMPPMGTMLTPRELRDVVEYISTLK